jgi:hypothetical protein
MPKTNEQVASLAQEWIRLSDSNDSTTLQNDRFQAFKYYYGEPFGNERDGRSDYVSRDVFDAVEDTKAILLEVFASNRQTVRYTPKDADDVVAAKLRTRYCDLVFNKQNNGFANLHDSIQDALLSKICISKTVWEEREETTKYSASITPEQYSAMEDEDNIEIIEAIEESTTVIDPMMGEITQTSVQVEWKEVEVVGQTRITIVPPERFVRDSNADNISQSRYCGEYSEVTRSDLLEMGFDADLVESLAQYEHAEGEFDEQARDEGEVLDQDLILEHSVDKFDLYELYMWFDDDDDGKAELHQVFLVGTTVLDRQEVDRFPYQVWSAYRVAHKFEGQSTYDVIHDIQKLKSTFKRQIADNLLIGNNQSRIAKQDAFVNPRDLIDNPIGGVHWVKNSVMDVRAVIADNPAPQISAITMPALEMLDRDKEMRAGVSRLTSGLNQDVITNQNADSLISRMSNSAMRRVMVMARSYAELFLIPLYQEIYRLGLENDQEGIQAEVDGDWSSLVPQEMGESADMETSVALTPDEADMRAQSLALLNQMLSADPTAQAIYTPQNKYEVMREVFNLSGHPDAGFLTNPQSDIGQLQQQMAQIQQQMQEMGVQNQQLQMAVQQYQQMGIEARMQDAQTRAQKAQGDLMAKNEDLNLKAQKQDGDQRIAQRKQALAEDAEAHDQVIDDLELAIERQQGRSVTIR